MARFTIRNITKVLQSAANRLFGAGADGVPRELEPAEVRTMLDVYTTAQVDGLISAIDGLTSADIDTLAELNAILSDADVASRSYVDATFVPSSTLSESIDDRVNALLVAGTNITITYNDAANTLTIASTASGGIGGSTGATDNAILRADGTGGSTAQSSAATLDDSGNAVFPGSIKINGSGANSALIRSDGSLGLQFYWQITGSPGKGVAMAMNSFLPVSGMTLGESGFGWPQIWLSGNGVITGSSSAITVSGPNATFVPLCVKGAASQTANLQEWQNSAGVVGARVTSTQRFSHRPSGVGEAEQFGDLASVAANGAAFGYYATTSTFGAAFGQSAYAGSFCTALGRVAGTPGTSGGAPAAHGFSRCISICDGTDFYAPTASNQLHVSGEYTEAFFGQRIFDTSPTSSIRFQGGGASGTNIAGTSVVWAGGRSTGNATPATFTIQTTTVGSSGTTLQALRDAVLIDGNTTAGETPLLLLDISKGTLQRVSIGAADSGGTGFKVLRVPN